MINLMGDTSREKYKHEYSKNDRKKNTREKNKTTKERLNLSSPSSITAYNNKYHSDTRQPEGGSQDSQDHNDHRHQAHHQNEDYF